MKLKRKNVSIIIFIFIHFDKGKKIKYFIIVFAEKRLEFEKRRKMHYNEFEAIKLARKLIEEEDDEEDDGSKPESCSTNTEEPGPSETIARTANEVEMNQ